MRFSLSGHNRAPPGIDAPAVDVLGAHRALAWPAVMRIGFFFGRLRAFSLPAAEILPNSDLSKTK
jgi:hypothetical protein